MDSAYDLHEMCVSQDLYGSQDENLLQEDTLLLWIGESHARGQAIYDVGEYAN